MDRTALARITVALAGTLLGAHTRAQSAGSPGGAARVEVCPRWPDPPFAAWLRVDEAIVHARSDARAPTLGTLVNGDRVRVLSCLPRCDAPSAWALVEGGGAVRLSLFTADPPDPDALGRAASARYRYGRVRDGGARLYARPDPAARVIGRQRAGHDLAFRIDDELLARGWLRRPDGRYVPLASIRLAHPSLYAGEHDPAAPIAFVVRATSLVGDDGQRRAVLRGERFPVRGGDARRVRVSGGTLPRAAVRIAWSRARPEGVPAGARWVHIDVREQVLTAYEGERLVFATLISTGKPGRRTRTRLGLFPVWLKTAHAAMHGPPEDPYLVNEVPFVLYFWRSMGLHGTFWHDRFGTAVSHGCVNLSMTDAEWMFGWAPPALPAGWHAISPEAAALPTLWVKVERARPGPLPAGGSTARR